MASVDDVISNSTETIQFFNPGESGKKKIIPKQVYYAYIKEVSIKEVSVRKRYRAKVYNMTLELADANKNLTFHDNGQEIKGDTFVGREIRTTGVFLFLNPSETDNWEPNNGGNEKYLGFCEKVGIECPEVEVELDGEKTKVKQFPVLEASDLIGKPVRAYIVEEKWTDKEGKSRTSVKAISFDSWDAPLNDDIKDKHDDIPF
tara:strand:+ start:3965 stop:4573 length:609 start_codon:yes stop_codon:yes gene_type:complete